MATPHSYTYSYTPISINVLGSPVGEGWANLGGARSGRAAETPPLRNSPGYSDSTRRVNWG